MAGKRERMLRIYQKPEACRHSFIFPVCAVRRTIWYIPFSENNCHSDKKSEKSIVEHLTPEAMKLLLEQPDKHTRKGRRDLTLMSILYDTGARVQELIDIRVCDVILENSAVIILTGKGKKKEGFQS
jgi:integrase